MTEKHTTSIAHLQTALEMEMTAIHQYQLHAHVLEDWGLDKLARRMRDELQEEMGHLDSFIARIIYLGGTPELKMAGTPVRATSLKGLFEADLKDETEAIRTYTNAAQEAQKNDDLGTRALLERVVTDEEAHQDWLQTQLDLLDRVGEQNYAARFMETKPQEG